MLRRLINSWNENINDNYVLILFFSFCAMAIFCGLFFYFLFFYFLYVDTHRTIILDDDIKVQVIGRIWYLDKVKETGQVNQFFSSNRLEFVNKNRNMCMSPSFKIVNMGVEARKIKIHSLSGRSVPISGEVHLEPGQWFRFQIKSQSQHWYCWINPVKKNGITIFNPLFEKRVTKN